MLRVATSCLFLTLLGSSAFAQRPSLSTSSPAFVTNQGQRRLGKAKLTTLLESVGEDATTVLSALDGLGRSKAAAVYRSVYRWSEDRPELTGTLPQATRALAMLVRQERGAVAVYRVVSSLSPSASQSFLIGLATTLGAPYPWAEARAHDSLTALGVKVDGSYVDLLVGGGLGPEITSLRELNGLRLLDPAVLPARKREALRLARLAVPAPNPGERLQKVIKLSDLEKFLRGEFQPTVGGSVAFYDQVAFLKTPRDLIAGLRLDYPNGFQAEKKVGALVFPRPPELRVKVPFDTLLGGTAHPDLVYPFTGTGFTGSVGGRFVPEFTLLSSVRMPLPEGTQALEIGESGERRLRATLDGAGRWVGPNGVLLGAPARAALTSPRDVTYQGYPLSVVARDAKGYEVASYGRVLPEGLLHEQTRLGPVEYVGRLTPTELYP